MYAPLKAQNNLNILVRNAGEKEPLIGATAVLAGTSNGAVADVNGIIRLKNIPDGKQTITFSMIGYKERTDTLNFPYNDTLFVYLETEGDELEEVTISSTRSSRSINDIPTRVEFIAGEELDEKANMKPGDIRMALSESTGIQTQQTSATSANSSIRIQGLDGRYTQILKDGFPLFSGYSGGLGLLQTPPLDLKQIEVVKGSASTLYGGGAISGLVNLISKTPSKERELRFLINGTSAGGLDVSGFYGKQLNKKIGVTLFASSNSNAAYDPAGIDLSAIPKFSRYTINPKLFINFTEKTNLVVGLNTAIENRIGGDMHYIRGDRDSIHSYYEENDSKRLSTQLAFEHRFGKCSHFTVKNSYNTFNRIIKVPNYTFNGTQNATFTEINYANHGERAEWIAGVNLWTDQFSELKQDTMQLRNYNQTTYGAFVQNTFKATKWMSVESGVRIDYVQNYEPVILPRASLLFKINPKITSRVGGGFGYKAPTIFTEESERIQYQNVVPINKTNILEKSYGANADVNYRTVLGERLTFSINQLFFYTYLDNPLTLIALGNGLYQLQNISGHIDSKGTETNIKLGYKDFKLFLGYTYTETKIHNGGLYTTKTLTPRDKINAVLFYEADEKWKIGLEGYYFSPQKLGDGTTGRDYWLCGFMAERLWKKMSIYVNFENILNVRQTRYETIYTGTVTNPVFRDIYAPLDGFVVNGGIKIKL